MNQLEVLEIARDAVIVVIKIASPVMLIALLVGLTVSLFQALTQIQEMTLAFVPKILVIFISMVVFLPFMLATLMEFAKQLMDRIVALG
ncbi:MAG: flagellar biosynthesis protein FliQ [Alphaproteobacteria bacterium]|nr:flagellar biosynthesis protein FliQ [Alphaproteobacteria bacterium]